MKKISAVLVALLYPLLGSAESLTQYVEIKSIGTSTYYVDSHIRGSGNTKLLVDTGSGYSTINEETLEQLKLSGNAEYVKKLEGVMANGSRMIVPVYRISSLNLGGKCSIMDVEVAVFPSGTRQILGLSALSKVSPFTFNINPPGLTLSNCQAGDTTARSENMIEKVKKDASLEPTPDINSQPTQQLVETSLAENS